MVRSPLPIVPASGGRPASLMKASSVYIIVISVSQWNDHEAYGSSIRRCSDLLSRIGLR